MNFEKHKELNAIVPKIENIGQVRILELRNNPNFVVKEIKLKEIESEYNGKLNGDYKATELAELGKELFDELQSRYGVNSPVKFFFGQNKDGETILFSVVDKITSIEPIQEEKEDVAQKFYQLYESLSRYYLDKLRSGGAFLTDINGSTQYVYGRKLTGKNNNEKEIYLVDTDIYLDDRRKSLLTVVYWLARHNSGIDKNSQMIENIKTFISEYQKEFTQIDDKDKERLTQLNKFLSGQEFGNEILPAIPTFEEK